ncbi:YidB family protein [Actinocrispum sp. NPDC049592]|uniref:YidB family protein n=1 Tax=Actinocrispum sp. NPDC049592 TaxID=3154835 RepID=UPI00344151A5
MNDIGKLEMLLDDPQVRELILGLGYVESAPRAVESGAPRLHAVVLHLAETTSTEQYASWLSDEVPNRTMTADQVRKTIGDTAIDDLAQLMSASSSTITWQLAVILPDFVDAVSPGGQVVDVNRLAREILDASAEDDREAGGFGSRVH